MRGALQRFKRRVLRLRLHGMTQRFIKHMLAECFTL
jgi:hypothetical protein